MIPEEPAPLPPDKLPLLQFFQSELKDNISLFKNNIQLLHSGTFSDQTLIDLENAVQSIKGAAKLLHLEPLTVLTRSIEKYLATLHSGNLTIEPNHEGIIQKCLDLFLTLSKTNPKEFFDFLKKNSDTFHTLAQKLDSMVNSSSEAKAKINLKAREEIREKDETVKERISHNSLPKLEEYSLKAKNDLIKFRNENFSDEQLQELIKTFEGIKETSLKLEYTLAFQLAQIIESHLQTLQKKHLPITSNLCNYLHQSVDLFIEAVKNSGQDNLWFAHHLKDFQSISEIFLNESSSAIEQEIKDIPQDKGMLNLFTIELETQVEILNNGLLQFEKGVRDPDYLALLMRAAHSIKGAARVVQLESVVRLAHTIEDFFVAISKKEVALTDEMIDLLFQAVDFLGKLSKVSDTTLYSWVNLEKNHINGLIDKINELFHKKQEAEEIIIQQPIPEIKKESAEPSPIARLTDVQAPVQAAPDIKTLKMAERDKVLRVTAQNLNRLMGLAGEYLVESRWLPPFANSLLKLKREQTEIIGMLDHLRDIQKHEMQEQRSDYIINNIRQLSLQIERTFSDRIIELEVFIRRYSNLADRLYREVLDSRMRPFADGIIGIPRMIRDLARQLGKKVDLEIIGENTQVDREILEKLEAPLTHMLRNAIDHGIELPEKRINMGKPPEGKLLLEAQHKAGMLWITVKDDGRGLDIDDLRKQITDKGLVSREMALNLTQQEVVDFLFLPGFSTAPSVTEISGRGIGLSAVQSLVQEVGGSIHLSFEKGNGMSINLQLPLTLSVTRSLLVQIAGEPYAFPLTRISKVLTISRDEIEVVENKQYFKYEDQNIGIIPAYQILELEGEPATSRYLPIVIISDMKNSYGVVVEEFLGEKELVVQELDPLLGKVSDIISGAYMENGDPILIIDIEDMIRSIDKLLSVGVLNKVESAEIAAPAAAKKRILVVDDSITVREVECRLLLNKGYEVDTAINGVDGWNAVRIGNYDLVITDVDMPRMNGIEFVKHIKSDPRLKNMPVMIVSYKEREEDRVKGLNAGANYYLTKSSFHDESLVNAVLDLIGKP